MRNLSIAVLSLSISLVACGGNTPAPATAQNTSAETHATSSVPFIAQAELAQRLQTKPAETFVFDSNGKESFAEGHMPRAKHLPYDQVKADALPADKNAFLVFYCANEQCGASHQAAEAAIKLGYTNAHVYAGGIDGWRKGGMTIEK